MRALQTVAERISAVGSRSRMRSQNHLASRSVVGLEVSKGGTVLMSR